MKRKGRYWRRKKEEGKKKISRSTNKRVGGEEEGAKLERTKNEKEERKGKY